MSAGNRGYEYRLRLGPDAAGVPLLEYLARRYPGTAESDWLDRIGAGRVLLDGVPVASDTLLAPGRELTWSRPPWKEPRVPLDYAILHLDAHLLAVAKPAGLPTMPGGGLFMEHTLLALVRRRFPHANPLHRLGRGTSGVVLFALTKEAFARVSSLWGGGRTLKLYRALASSLPDRDMFEIDVPIGPVPHALLGTVHAAHPAGNGPTAGSGSSSAAPAPRWSRSRSPPAARTRSASTWPRPATRSWATPCTAPAASPPRAAAPFPATSATISTTRRWPSPTPPTPAP